MLTLFPDLLNYSFFGPTIIRLTLGCILLTLAYQHLTAREHICHEMRARFGLLAPAISFGLPTLGATVGALIVTGLFTQVAAFFTILLSVKFWVVRRTYRSIATPGALALVLMGAIALSLLLTGPGALAFDLPL